jgi:hypothetical protein
VVSAHGREAHGHLCQQCRPAITELTRQQYADYPCGWQRFHSMFYFAFFMLDLMTCGGHIDIIIVGRYSEHRDTAPGSCLTL